MSTISAGQRGSTQIADVPVDLYGSDASPLRAQWKIVQRPDSERDRRALSALLGYLPEILCYLGSGIVLTTDDEAKETAEGGAGLDAQGSLSEWHSDFRAQRAVVGQKIQPGMSQHREQFRFQA